uniref:Uncharacterized protein n=1 Tax=Pectobacterium phage Amona TaxID=3158137 RepID=A0AB39ABF2_9CAUD
MSLAASLASDFPRFLVNPLDAMSLETITCDSPCML